MRLVLAGARWSLAAVLPLLLLIGTVLAQNTAAVVLNTDEPATGTLSADNIAQVYFFVGIEGDVVNLTVSSNDQLPLGVLLTDNRGDTLAQTSGESSAESPLLLPDVTLEQTGTFFVTVFAATTAEEIPADGSFSILLTRGALDSTEPPAATPAPETAEADDSTPVETAELAEPTEVVADTPEPPAAEETAAPGELTYQEPEQTLLANGIEVELAWQGAFDLNLEVRDPVGNTLYFDSRTSPIGGSFGFDANGLCEVVVEDPAETASWSPGFLPTGSYEILVFYRQACETEEPVPFTVNVSVDGAALEPIEGALQPPVGDQDSVYLANFIVREDGSAVANAGGLYPDSSLNTLPDDPQTVIERAVPITRDEVVTGSIVEEQDYLSYSFEGQANEIVSVDLQAISGSLDTLLQVIDAQGNLIGVNDDFDVTTRNSSLPNLRLLDSGMYYIVATRYGKEIGGTEGEFELLLTGATDELPPEVAQLDLPAGAIQVSLTWATNADLQLLVRDPFGEPVFDDQPQVNSGGLLAADGNVNCTQSEGPPVSYIYWPPGNLRPGIYETEVWFQNNCNDTTPVTFTLSVLVNGEVVLVERANPVPGQRYVTSFTVNPDGTATAGPGGFIDDALSELDYEAETPLPITAGQTVTGSITPTNVFDVYALNGSAGDVVTISMLASSQTLDTNLFLIGPNGIVLVQNDDADALLLSNNDGRTTDSVINAFTLPENGEYRIIATRFALQYGGTIGGYTLSVEGS